MKLNEARGLSGDLVVEMTTNGILWDTEATEPLYKSIFLSMARFLGMTKKKNELGVSLIYRDIKGNFILAGIVKYHEPESEETETPGNWSFEITTNEDDVKGTQEHSSQDEYYKAIFLDTAKEKFRFHLIHPHMYVPLISIPLQTLVDWLDKNAISATPVDIELEGYFLASAGVENDTKQIGIVPDGEMKHIIKNDADL